MVFHSFYTCNSNLPLLYIVSLNYSQWGFSLKRLFKQRKPLSREPYSAKYSSKGKEYYLGAVRHYTQKLAKPLKFYNCKSKARRASKLDVSLPEGEWLSKIFASLSLPLVSSDGYVLARSSDAEALPLFPPRPVLSTASQCFPQFFLGMSSIYPFHSMSGVFHCQPPPRPPFFLNTRRRCRCRWLFSL